MANKSTVFPAFLRMEYDQGDAKARFKADLQDINRTIEAAVKRPGQGGAINLGLGDLQKAKQDAQQFAQAARQVLSAAEQAARGLGGGYNELTAAIGGTTKANYEAEVATRSYMAAARATVTEANARVQSIDAEIRAMQILQTELNKTAAARATGKPDLTFGAERIVSGQGAGLSGTGKAAQEAKASIDSAALSMATLESVMGRVNREGQKSRQTFDTITGSSREAARAADQLQRDLDELRGSIDPLYYATRKYNEEQERANRLLKAGSISADEHGRAMQVAGAQYNAAMRNAAGSTSNLRQATVQTGQQLQDIAISLYSGQRAGTVFAQQLPQLAFALSSLEGSANKTHDRIGQFAAFLSGPWGVAVGLAVGALATYVAGLFGAEEQSGKTQSATEKLSESLDFSAQNYDVLIDVMKEYNASLVTEEALTYKAAEAASRLAREKLKLAEARLLEIDAVEVGFEGYVEMATARERRVKELRAEVDAADNSLFTFRAKAAIDPSTAVNQKYDRQVLDAEQNRKAERARAKTLAEKDAVDRKYIGIQTDINKERQAELDSLKESGRASGKKSRKGRKASSGPSVREQGLVSMEVQFLDPITGKPFDPKRGITSGFGKRSAPVAGASTNHRGLDIAAAIGTPVRATASGVVSQVAFQKKGAGKWIEIDHGGGTKTRYMHLSDQDVVPGQIVEAGDVIGKSGNTGRSSGPHLHYEVWRNGTPVDPRKNASAPVDDAGVMARAMEAEERAAEAAERRAEQQLLNSQNYANEIANINAQWDEQPRLIDQSAKAVRDLDLIIAELKSAENADLPNQAKLIADAQAAQVKAGNAVSTELNRHFDLGQRNLQILELQAQGLNDQAAIQEEINQLDERLGIRRANDDLLQQQEVMAENVRLAKEENVELKVRRAELTGQLGHSKTTLEEKKQINEELVKINREEAKIRIQIGGALLLQKGIGEQIVKNEALQTKMVDGVTAEYYQRQALNREIERANAIMDEQVGLVRDVESSLRGVFTGQNNAGDFFKDINKAFQQYGGNRLFDSIFGDAFDILEEELRKDTPMGKATDKVVKDFNSAGTAAIDLAASFAQAQGLMNATPGNKAKFVERFRYLSPSNGDGEIPVERNALDKVAQRVRVEARSVEDMSTRIAKGIVDPLLAGWEDIFGTKFMDGLSGVLTGALAGYMRAGNVGAAIGGAKSIAGLFGASSETLQYFDQALTGAERGGQYNQILSGILGKKRTSRVGSQIGGAAGGALGFAIGGPAGAQVGQLAGSILGSLVGGIFKKKKYGTASLSGSGAFGVSGNSSAYRDDAEGLGNSVMEGLNRISDALGGAIGAFSTSIGLYKGKFRVSTTGRTGKLKGKYGDVTDFGDDEEAAIRFAIADAIKDGAITGLRAATQRLLQQGDDVDAQLQKALDFEGVFSDLKAIKDPVGAALDTLDKEFQRLIKIFGEAGASSEEYAQLEELYGIRRSEAIEEANNRVLSSLRGLLNDLTIGDAGLSLRSRLSSAQAAYNPLAARVAAGDTTAYDDYADAARQLLDLQREVYGSTNAYFALLDEVTSLTQSRVDAESNVSSIAAGRPSPFDTTQVSTAVTDQTQILGSHLSAINDNIITLIETINASGGNAAGLARIGNF